MKQEKTAESTSQNMLIYLWKNTNFAVWLLVLAVFCALFCALRSILLPFVAGIVLGYLFDPLALRFEKMGISRTWATILVFLIVILIMTPLLVLLIGVMNNQLSILISSVPAYAASLSKKAAPLLEYLQTYFPDLDAEGIKKTLSENTAHTLKLGGKLLQSVFENSMAIVNVLSLLLIAPIVAFYMLRDWNVLAQKTKDLLPRKHKKEIEKILKKIDAALSGFIRGQLSVCIILGVYYALSLKLVGLDLGLLVGFIAGLISFIPYVGSITGFVLSMILAFSEFNDTAHIAAVIVVFLLGQFIEGNFLTPKLVGDKVGLHPVWVMFALLAGGALMGFLGLMIAVPVAAVIGILLREGIQKYKKSNLYLK